MVFNSFFIILVHGRLSCSSVLHCPLSCFRRHSLTNFNHSLVTFGLILSLPWQQTFFSFRLFSNKVSCSAKAASEPSSSSHILASATCLLSSQAWIEDTFRSRDSSTCELSILVLFASVGLSGGFYEAALNSLFCFRERENPAPSFFNETELSVDI